MVSHWFDNEIASFLDDLQHLDCLESPDLPLPNLSNDIHPVFRLRRWMRDHCQRTDMFYLNMLPALKFYLANV